MGRLTAAPGRLQPAPRAVAPVQRDSARERGYGTRWERESLAFRHRHPLCLGCEAVGRVAATRLTDHVIPHTHGSPRFWDQDWWQPACKWHHDVVKQALERRFDAGEIGADDLWLDSAVAVAATWKERPEG